jgi:SpoVK/Ycf46/Vps4 family AAA+-type ATPase
MSHADFVSLAVEFQKTLEDCRNLYLSSAKYVNEQRPGMLGASADEYLHMMDDLHKGLLIKTYVSVASADRKWSKEERVLAEMLFEHIWHKQLQGEQLKEAFRHIAAEASRLRWHSLMRPFEEIDVLRGRVAELETIVMRLANLIAKADGETTPGESGRVQVIQDEVHRNLHRLPLDEPGQHEAASQVRPQAVQKMKAETAQLRSKIDLEKPSPDIKTEEPSREEKLAAALEELDALVGMDSVKHEVRTMTNFLKVQKEREKAGLPRTPITLHMVFTGNPGTGKTTVARIIGRIFGAMGILEKGHLIETDRSGLVAEYAGQTGPKTNKKIDEALDGVLFIDEAYSLAAEGGQDAYGDEAVQALLKRMEDNRDRLVVILAGYPEPLDRLLKSNPGLSSRFNRRLDFEDYRASEMGRIFSVMCERNQYETPALVRAKLVLGFHHLYQNRDEHFGNGRLVRNVFEEAIRRMANRIAQVDRLTKELLTVLDPSDIAMSGVPASVWSELDQPDRTFILRCPSCGDDSPLAQQYLGRRVRCRKCDHTFEADWGEVSDPG